MEKNDEKICEILLECRKQRLKTWSIDEQEQCEGVYKPQSWEESRNSHFDAYKGGWEAAWTLASDLVEKALGIGDYY